MAATELGLKRKEWLFLALAFVCSFLSYTWHNQFPYYYHSDEESKALQLLYDYRNFWHPMLTLNATDALCHLFAVGPDPQKITVVGRTLAAFFSSTGLAGMIAFAFQRKGLWAGVVMGVFLFTCPLIFEVSHYCKEDPALFMSLALSLLAWNSFSAKPHTPRALLLGVATGLAISAKYPGLFLVPLFMCAVFFRVRQLRPVFFFLLAAVLTTLAINWQWVFHSSELIAGLHRENRMLASGHDGVARAVPHTLYLQILRYEHGWLLLATAVLGVAFPLFQKRRLTLEVFLAGMAVAALIGLSFLAKVSDRYLLPVMLIVLFQATIGLLAVVQRFSSQHRIFVGIFLLAALSWHQVELFTAFIQGFRTDSRADLVSWIGAHLPENARVATSLWTRLPGRYPGQYASSEIPLDYVADYGSTSDLAAAGFGWVAVSDVELQPFTEDKQVGGNGPQATFERRRAFYRELEKNHPVLWQAPPGLVYVLHPGLRLYRLQK